MTPERRQQLLMSSRLGRAVMGSNGAVEFAFNKDQPRAKDGKFGEGGGSNSGDDKGDKGGNTALTDAQNSHDHATQDRDAAATAWDKARKDHEAGKIDSQTKKVVGQKLEDAEYRLGDAKRRLDEATKSASTAAKPEPPKSEKPAKPVKTAKPAKSKGKTKESPKPAVKGPRAAEGKSDGPQTHQGRAVADIYARAASATNKDESDAAQHLSTMKPDEVKRVATAMGFHPLKSDSGKKVAGQIVKHIADRRGAAIRSKLIDRPKGDSRTTAGQKATAAAAAKLAKAGPVSNQELAASLRKATSKDMATKSSTNLRATVDAALKTVKTKSGLADLYLHITNDSGNDSLRKRMAGKSRKNLEQMVHNATTGVAGSYHRASA